MTIRPARTHLGAAAPARRLHRVWEPEDEQPPRCHPSGFTQQPSASDLVHARARLTDLELRWDELQLELTALPQEADRHPRADQFGCHQPLQVLDRRDRGPVHLED